MVLVPILVVLGSEGYEVRDGSDLESSSILTVAQAYADGGHVANEDIPTLLSTACANVRDCGVEGHNEREVAVERAAKCAPIRFFATPSNRWGYEVVGEAGCGTRREDAALEGFVSARLPLPTDHSEAAGASEEGAGEVDKESLSGRTQVWVGLGAHGRRRRVSQHAD